MTALAGLQLTLRNGHTLRECPQQKPVAPAMLSMYCREEQTQKAAVSGNTDKHEL